MSVYGTWLRLSHDEHEHGCAVWVENPPGSDCFEWSHEPCDCGQPKSPLLYQGSHVLPSNDDERGGWLDVAGIPDYITRDGRDDAHGTGLKDWLRLIMGDQDGKATLVLTRQQVQELRDVLTLWLEREEIKDLLMGVDCPPA